MSDVAVFVDEMLKESYRICRTESAPGEPDEIALEARRETIFSRFRIAITEMVLYG
jgi:hypothetical protein